MICLPKVSVIILAYNVVEYIEKCVNSVIDQTFKEIEIIIINDGSTDDTQIKIKEFQDERITVVNKKNGGVSSARNEGVSRATGEYIFQLDGDDWIDEDLLNQMYLAAKEKNVDVLIATNYLEEYKNISILKSIDVTGLHGDLLKDALMGNIFGYSWLKLYKTSIFKEHNIKYPLDISYAEDVITDLYFFHCCTSSATYKNCAYVHYMQRNSSISNFKNEKTLHDHEKLVTLVKKFLEEKGITNQYKEEIAYVEFMQYIYSVINSRIFPRIHKTLYKKMSNRINDLIENYDFIRETYNKLSLQTRIGFRAYKMNYYLGICLKKIYLLLVKTKKEKYILS